MHQDWRNLWTSFKTPITSRWISVDGLVKNVFGYNVGDFRQKYSPLTLYSPDIDIEYEPEIFARMRKTAMQEMFLGDNERVMQGVNLNFDAEIVPLFKEFHLNALGSRLRAGELPESGSMVKLDVMDKYFFGTNLDLMFVPDYTFGGSFLQILDARYTFAGTLESADVLQQRTRVYAGRGSVGTAPFADEKKFNMKLSSEVAISSDDSSWHDTTMITATTFRTTLKTERVQGVALSADLNTFVKLGAASDMTIGAGFIRNSRDFRNELAQSPTFYPARVMNSENDAATASLKSSFDALYRHVFKFSPSENSGWTKGPMSKIAYFNGILTQEELSDTNFYNYNNPLCLVMPYGPATANRMGARGKIAFNLADKAVQTSVSGGYMQEIKGMPFPLNPSSTMPESKFFEVGGGLSIDFAAFGEWWPYPFILSGGYTDFSI
jgi:hypothetical protein